MNIHPKLFYSKEHEWIRINEYEVTIGITDYAQSQLGDIIFIEMPEIEDQFSAGEVIGEIEAVKTVSELYAPVSGAIIEINNQIDDKPELVNSDPYGKGWLLKIQCPKLFDEKSSLLSPLEYEKIIS